MQNAFKTKGSLGQRRAAVNESRFHLKLDSFCLDKGVHLVQDLEISSLLPWKLWFTGRQEDALAYVRTFFPWYSEEHRHIGIGFMTPEQVHYGIVPQILEALYEFRKVTRRG